MKKSSSGGRRSVPRRHRKVRKSSVFGLSPLPGNGVLEAEDELEDPLVSF